MTPRYEAAIEPEVMQSAEPISPAEVESASLDASPEAEVYVFPASLEQSRYWILDQLDGASTASNMAIAFRLEGKVNDDLVERALRALVLRHEALRTTFRLVDGELSQIISEEPDHGFTISDLRHLPLADARQQAEEQIHEHSHVQIDLESGPVFYVHLIHVTDQDHFLAFTIHHIACDGWSNGILVRDFAAHYTAFARNQPPELPELPFQFADFTVWQQNWLDSEAASAALEFWKEHVQRNLQAIDLPLDHPRPAKKSVPGNIESRLWPRTLEMRLKDYARHHDATMHQVLLAGFEALIARYADQTEFLLGSTIANRTQPGMEHVVGRFAHPQIVLADVHGDPTYKELLGRVADWSARAYAHQDLPFSRVMEAFQLDRAGVTSQFLQVYFVYQKAFMQPQQAEGLTILPRPSVSGGVNFDLLVSIVERAEGPRLQIEYNTVIFTRARIHRLLDQYTRLLEAVMENDALRVSEMPLLAPEAQLEQPAETQSAPATAPIAEVFSLPEWFDRRAARSGAEVAIVNGDQRITWESLAAKSRQYAAALHKSGVASGQTVAISIEDPTESAAAVLGALRIGATVLPLPEGTTVAAWKRVQTRFSPAASLASRTVAESISGVISFESLRSAAPSPVELPYPAPRSTAWLGLALTPSGDYQANPVSHQATLQNLLAAARPLDMRAGDAILIHPATSSVDSFTDLLLPLVTGARAVHRGKTTPLQIQALLDREQVTFALGTPADWMELLSAGWKGDRRLQILCRGGRLPSHLANRLSAASGRLWSMLPLAAAAGYAGIAALDPEKDLQWPVAPLAGQPFHILDGAGNPAPIGSLGELSIGAAPVRTGYLARYAPDRGYEIVDSVDRSVHLHGYRLRLGELEDLLLQHPGVAAAAAAIVPDASGQPALVGYVTASSSENLSVPEVTSFLRTAGPGHFASAEIILVDSLPKRIDGSTDIALLPPPGAAQSNPVEAPEYIPPRDELETKLVAIWEEVLGVHGIGVRTSFFSLGGYSLMIVRLFARINKVLQTALPITAIFNAPTIEQLADILRGQSSVSCLVPVQPRGTKPPFFMIHSYLLYGSLPGVFGNDQPFYGLRELVTDRQAEQLTIEARVAAYAREIRSVQPKGPYYIGGWCAAGPLAVETARQFVEAGETVGMVLLFDSWRPGYSAEIAGMESNRSDMSRKARLSRKYRFHRNKLRQLSTWDKARYLISAALHKLRSSRDRFYFRNWANAQKVFTRLGLPLPAFMHNISLATMNAVSEYKGKPFPGRITLIRATDAVYVPGCEPDCGWGAIATQGVDVHFAPGSHESMFVEPQLNVLGEMLRKSIADAHAAQGGA